MTKMKWDDIVTAVEDEARRMRHNASLRGMHIDCIETDAEAAVFDEALGVLLESWLAEKTYEMQQKFGVDLELTTYGRGGATIAPEGWWSDGGFVHGFDVELNWSDPWNRNLDGYNEDLRTLRIMQWVNDEVAAGVRELPAWWEAERLEWQYWVKDDSTPPEWLPVGEDEPDVLDALEMMAL